MYRSLMFKNDPFSQFNKKNDNYLVKTIQPKNITFRIKQKDTHGIKFANKRYIKSTSKQSHTIDMTQSHQISPRKYGPRNGRKKSIDYGKRIDFQSQSTKKQEELPINLNHRQTHTRRFSSIVEPKEQKLKTPEKKVKDTPIHQSIDLDNILMHLSTKLPLQQGRKRKSQKSQNPQIQINKQSKQSSSRGFKEFSSRNSPLTPNLKSRTPYDQFNLKYLIEKKKNVKAQNNNSIKGSNYPYFQGLSPKQEQLMRDSKTTKISRSIVVNEKMLKSQDKNGLDLSTIYQSNSKKRDNSPEEFQQKTQNLKKILKSYKMTASS